MLLQVNVCFQQFRTEVTRQISLQFVRVSHVSPKGSLIFRFVTAFLTSDIQQNFFMRIYVVLQLLLVLQEITADVTRQTIGDFNVHC